MIFSTETAETILSQAARATIPFTAATVMILISSTSVTVRIPSTRKISAQRLTE